MGRATALIALAPLVLGSCSAMDQAIALSPSLTFRMPDRRYTLLCSEGHGTSSPWDFTVFPDVSADWLPVEPARMVVSMKCFWPVAGLVRIQDNRCSALLFGLDLDFGGGRCDSVGVLYRNRGWNVEIQEIDLSPP